jgi:aerobic-type carbon monoxide dehydrogenase small subunit (CoxS/CutS family)
LVPRIRAWTSWCTESEIILLTTMMKRERTKQSKMDEFRKKKICACTDEIKIEL